MKFLITTVFLLTCLAVFLLYTNISDPLIYRLYTRAIDNDNLKNIKWLSSLSLNINARNDIGESPLYRAAYKKNVKAMELLVQNGADINHIAHDDITPMHEAALHGSTEAVQFLLNQGANINAKGTLGTPLHYAGTYCNYETVELLINSGADLHLTDKYGQMFFHSAAKCSDIVNFLLEKGEDINLKAHDGSTPLHHLVRHSRIDPDTQTRFFIENGAEINAKDNQGNTPLHEATKRGNIKTVTTLINSGANTNIKNSKGHIPFVDAVLVEDIDLAQLFIKAGVDKNSLDYKGNSPLQLILNQCHEDKIVPFLLSNNANVKNINHQGKSALHSLVESSCGNRSGLEAVSIIKKGGDINANDNFGINPYEFLIKECKEEKYGAAFILLDVINYKYPDKNDALKEVEKINCEELFNYF